MLCVNLSLNVQHFRAHNKSFLLKPRQRDALNCSQTERMAKLMPCDYHAFSSTQSL